MRHAVSRPDESPLSLPVPDPDVVARRVDDEIVLVHLGTSQIFALNPTGARFWELLQGCDSWEEIEGVLRTEFEVSQKVLRTSIAGLIASLETAGLVRPRPT